MSVSISISVNGEPCNVPVGTTVAELLCFLDIAQGRVAVERNRDVVPRAEHDQIVLAPGDRLEVVAFVGGGI